MSDRLVSIHRAAPGKHLVSQRDRSVAKFVPTKEKPLIVSVSELRDFMDCRVKWHLRHQERLEPAQGSENLSVGSLTHSILEAWNRLPVSKRKVTAMIRVSRELIKQTTLKQLNTENKELIEAMTVGYAHWTLNPENENSDAALGLKQCFPEEWFECKLTPDGSIILRGKYDNRFEPTRLKKTLGLLEFKTASQIKMSKFEQNLQVGGYTTSLWDLYGKKYKRIIVYPTVLRKQMPGPRVKAALFAREPVELTRDECEIWRADARRTALDMLDASIYANPGDRCEWMCDFRMPCMMRGSPSDMKHILKTEYQPKEYRA